MGSLSRFLDVALLLGRLEPVGQDMPGASFEGEGAATTAGMRNQTTQDTFLETALAEVIHRPPLGVVILAPGINLNVLPATQASWHLDALKPFVVDSLSHGTFPRLMANGKVWFALCLVQKRGHDDQKDASRDHPHVNAIF